MHPAFTLLLLLTQFVTSATTAKRQESDRPSSTGLAEAQIIGIAVGLPLGAVILGIGLCYFCCRGKRGDRPPIVHFTTHPLRIGSSGKGRKSAEARAHANEGVQQQQQAPPGGVDRQQQPVVAEGASKMG